MRSLTRTQMSWQSYQSTDNLEAEVDQEVVAEVIVLDPVDHQNLIEQLTEKQQREHIELPDTIILDM